MRVDNARVNWSDNFDNEPTLQILVNEYPKLEEFRFRKLKVFDGGSAVYFANHKGAVQFYYADSFDKKGYAGRGFTLTMEDGSTETIMGPWSSRAGVMNTMLPVQEHVLDVSITDCPDSWERGFTFTSAAIDITMAKKAVSIINENWRTKRHLRLSLVHNVKGSSKDIVYDIRQDVPGWRSSLPRHDELLIEAYRQTTENSERHIKERIERYFDKYYTQDWRELLDV